MNKPNNSTSDVMDKTMKPNKQKTDWEEEYFRRYQDGLWSDADSLAVDKSNEVKEFIRETLAIQRQQLIDGFLEITGEDEETKRDFAGWGEAEINRRPLIKNQLRSEIRERLKQL